MSPTGLSRRVLVSKDGVTNFVFGWVMVIFAVSGVGLRYTLLVTLFVIKE